MRRTRHRRDEPPTDAGIKLCSVAACADRRRGSCSAALRRALPLRPQFVNACDRVRLAAYCGSSPSAAEVPALAARLFAGLRLHAGSVRATRAACASLAAVLLKEYDAAAKQNPALSCIGQGDVEALVGALRTLAGGAVGTQSDILIMLEQSASVSDGASTWAVEAGGVEAVASAMLANPRVLELQRPGIHALEGFARRSSARARASSASSARRWASCRSFRSRAASSLARFASSLRAQTGRHGRAQTQTQTHRNRNRHRHTETDTETDTDTDTDTDRHTNTRVRTHPTTTPPHPHRVLHFSLPLSLSIYIYIGSPPSRGPAPPPPQSARASEAGPRSR